MTNEVPQPRWHEHVLSCLPNTGAYSNHCPGSDHGPVVSKSNTHQLQHIHKIQLQKNLGRLLRARLNIALRVPCRQTVNQGVSFKRCLEGNTEGNTPAISTSVTALSIVMVHALINIQPAKNMI